MACRSKQQARNIRPSAEAWVIETSGPKVLGQDRLVKGCRHSAQDIS